MKRCVIVGGAAINEDIKKCKVALNSQNSKSLYEVLYAKYRTLDDSIDDSIPKYAHGINDTNYDHELTALMTVLETYLLCDSIPAKTKNTYQDNINQGNKMNFIRAVAEQVIINSSEDI